MRPKLSKKLYYEKNNPLGWKTLIAAEYVGVNVEVPDFEYGKDNHDAKFLKKSPLGKVPCLETEFGCLTESNAIARYVAALGKKNLMGANPFEGAQVDQWIEFSQNDIVLPAAVWIFPILGYIPQNPTATQKAKGDVRKAMDILNKHLTDRTWLVGERISLADIVVAMCLYRCYTMVMDPPFRKSFPHTNRWFQSLVSQPEFTKVIGGATDLCEKMKSAVDLTKDPKHENKKDNKKDSKPNNNNNNNNNSSTAPKQEATDKEDKSSNTQQSTNPASAPKPSSKD